MPKLSTDELALPPFPNEIFREIAATFTPAYRLAGENALNLVNKTCNSLLSQDPRIPKRKTLQAIIASCHSAEDAFNILSDTFLIRQLDFRQLLQVVAYHPELTKEILINHGKTDIPAHVIVNMVDNHLWFSKYMIEKPELELRSKAHFLAMATTHLAKADLSIAMYFFSQSDFSRIMGGIKPLNETKEITQLIECFSKNTRARAQMPQPDCNFIITLGKAHLPIARLLIEKFSTMLKVYDNVYEGEILAWMAAAHLSIFKEVVDDPEKLKEIGRAYLRDREEYNPEVENNAKELKKIGLNSLIRYAAQNPDIVHHLLKHPVLINEFDATLLSHIGEAQLFFAHYILDKKDLLNKLNEQQLNSLGNKHIDIAERLSSNTLTPKLADRMLSPQALAEKIEAPDFGIDFCIKSHYTNAEYILNHPKFSSMLNSERMIVLSNLYPALADKALQCAKSREDLPSLKNVHAIANIFSTIEEFVTLEKLRKLSLR